MPGSNQPSSPASSVDPADVARFEELGEDWWDLWGPMRALHRLNPVRVAYIADILKCELSGQDKRNPAKPLAGLTILDIGCGAGILSEPLARLGAVVTGIDPAPGNIAIAQAHAAKSGLTIQYQAVTAESLAAEGRTFDVVLVMEVVEHVTDRNGFLDAAASLVRPGGFLFAATLNRTARSYILAIIGAEYILRWVKRGTHDWRQFVTPSELADDLRGAGMTIYDKAGVVYQPLFDEWRKSEDCSVNYMMAAEKPLD